jgi:hypothetical protein
MITRLLLCVTLVSGQLCEGPNDQNCLVRQSGVCKNEICHSCPESPEYWRRYPAALVTELVISESCVPGFDGDTGDGVVKWSSSVVINSVLNVSSESETMTIRGPCPLFVLNEGGNFELSNVDIDCTSGRDAIIIMGRGNWILKNVQTNSKILVSATAVHIGELVADNVVLPVDGAALVLEETNGNAKVTCVSNQTRVVALPNSGILKVINCIQINLKTQLSYIGYKFLDEFVQNSAFDYTGGLVTVLIVLSVISVVTILLILFQWSSNYYRKKNE